MSRIVNQLSQRLATNSTSRGFLATLGKVALGAAALSVGSNLTTASAGPPPPDSGCCVGTNCNSSNNCPGGCPYNNYTWVCCDSGGTYLDCHDCFTQPNCTA